MEGHSNSVLGVKVYDNNLYTAAAGKIFKINTGLQMCSKTSNKTFAHTLDRTVRIWDLNKTNGPTALLSHAGPVVAIENDRNNLLFSACGAFVRCWDLRVGVKAVKTLCSSGNTLSGNANVGLTSPGETPVTALSLGTSGNLYIAASDKVRIWDLRK